MLAVQAVDVNVNVFDSLADAKNADEKRRLRTTKLTTMMMTAALTKRLLYDRGSIRNCYSKDQTIIKQPIETVLPHQAK